MDTQHTTGWVKALRLHSLSLGGAVLLCLTLGLAPYTPEPHILKQIKNAVNGTLTEWIDLLDIVIHGVPFVVLLLVIVRIVRDARALSSHGRPDENPSHP